MGETLCSTTLLMKYTMAIIRRETHLGPRFDVEWRLPDRSKRRKVFKTEREARIFEPAIVTKTAAGDVVDPRAGRIICGTPMRHWHAEPEPTYGFCRRRWATRQSPCPPIPTPISTMTNSTTWCLPSMRPTTGRSITADIWPYRPRQKRHLAVPVGAKNAH